ncbi:MAG: PH domain-containing protein [Litorilinea sp.]
MIFKALPCRTRWEGLLVVLWVVLIQGLVLVWMARRPVDLIKFFLVVLLVASVPLLFYLLQRAWAAFSLEYWIDRNALTMVWSGRREVVALPAIRRIIRGSAAPQIEPTWSQWPAPYIGQGEAGELQNIRMVATRPLDECLLIETDDRVYAISPADNAGFLAALQERFRLGPVRLFSAELAQTGRISSGATSLLLIGGGLVGAMILFGLLMIRYPDLPDALAFQYNSDGVPLVVRQKTALFLLPVIGLLAWVFNGLWGLWMVYRRQITGAYMLWGGAIVVQLCALMALISLIN